MTSTAAIDPTHDVIVIGAGPGGEDTTSHLLRAGLSVAMVEEELVGGECFNWACIPSKAMLRPGHALRAAQRVPGAREVTGQAIDAEQALAFRDASTLHHDDTSAVADFEAAGADFIRGRGELIGERTVHVASGEAGCVLTARYAVVIATGSKSVYPDIPGLEAAQPWTNREATSAECAPRRLTVLGAGPVGLELAQAWKSLGSEHVTLLSRGASLLPAQEDFVGPLVLEGLVRSGVDVRRDVSVESVSRTRTGVEAVLSDGSTVVSDELLLATGKSSATNGLGLEPYGIVPGEPIDVDDTMRAVAAEWLYAVGDVNGRALLTHQASYHARIAAASIAARALGHEPRVTASSDERMIPQVIFTDPAVATVGLTSAQARAQGRRVTLRAAHFAAVLGAQLHAEGYTGTASVVIDDDRRVIIGATFVGQDVAEMVHAATIAIVGEVPLERLQHAVPSFPTMSEIWLDLIPQLDES